MILRYYTGLLRPCGVEINKDIKDRLKKREFSWRRIKNTMHQTDEKVPAPTRNDILKRLKRIWDEFPIQIAQIHKRNAVMYSKKEQIIV